MNIKEVAVRTGLSDHTIRFYEKSGVFPKIKRSKNGIREFTESDVNFLIFISKLKKTGMSLEDIADFTKEGCILERLESHQIPVKSVKNRLSILKEHQLKLLEQKRTLELFIEAVNQKMTYYERYLENTDKRETEDFK